jgi:hypothetical protein
VGDGVSVVVSTGFSSRAETFNASFVASAEVFSA